MSKSLKFKRTDNRDALSNFTPAYGEPVFFKNPPALYIGDGTTPGGLLVSPLNLITPEPIVDEYTAKENEVILVDCRSNPVKINLPVSPKHGTIVKIIDVYSIINSTNTVIVHSDVKINNAEINFVIDSPTTNTTLLFVSGLNNWIVDSHKTGSTQEFPPNDGKMYVIQNKTWVPITI